MTAPYFHSIFSGSIFDEIRIGTHVMTAPYEPNNENLVRFSNKIRNVLYFIDAASSTCCTCGESLSRVKFIYIACEIPNISRQNETEQLCSKRPLL